MNTLKKWYCASKRERGFSIVEIVLWLVMFAAVMTAGVFVLQKMVLGVLGT